MSHPEIEHWTVDERQRGWRDAASIGELIQSLEGEADADAEAAWSAEIRPRLDRVDAGTATTIPWSEARRRIHAAARRDPRA